MLLSLISMIPSSASLVVDQFRLDLECQSAFWFSVVEYAGYAVAIGCMMEAPETYVLLKRWWLLRYRDEDKEETKEEKKRWFSPLAAVGLLIVIIGIGVETFGEGKVSVLDAQLRAHESDKITSAEGDAASAIGAAGTARDSATEAAAAAARATGSATRAMALATRARNEAVSLEHSLTAAKAQIAKDANRLADALHRVTVEEQEQRHLESLVGPRRLTLKQQESIGKSCTATVQDQVIVGSYGMDSEGKALAIQIGHAIFNRSFPVTTELSGPLTSGVLNEGVLISGPLESGCL